MKRILCLILTLLCLVGALCGCDSLNKQPVTLEDSIAIPEDGIISADIFEELKQENKAVTFTGESGGVRYEWVIFGSNIKEAKDLNLGLEITEANSERLAFRFLSSENFGFSPVLSIYLNDSWDAQSATLTAEDGKEQQVTLTSTDKGKSILNFSPKTQTGAFIITPKVEPDTADQSPSDEPVSENPNTANVPEPSDTTSSEKPEPPQNTKPSDSQTSTVDDTKPTVPESPADSGRPISDGKNTEQDKYKTDPVPEGKPFPAEPEDQTVDTKKSYTCTLSIECSSILNHLSDLEPEKLDILPKNGIIFAAQTVTFYEGESVYDVLKRVCRENRIHMEASWTPMYNSAYVEGIGNLYEFDCGSGSGWMYRVDGWYPNYGCSRYQLKQGEVVEWRYTCDLGKDIGGASAVGG